jgi:hypothetical protein
MHKIQNKNYIILIIMYNQSNAITCLKCKAKILYIYILLGENLDLFRMKHHPKFKF